jgi:thiamine monophosphate synthase
VYLDQFLGIVCCVYFLGGMRIKDLEKTRKLGAQGIAGVSAF